MGTKQPVNVSVSRIIHASAETLYEMVSDITRMGEWSPECVSASWIKGASRPTVGARFKGDNETGPNKWSTKPTVTVADAGREFAFKVPGRSGPTWTYRFDPVDGGTRVTETVAQTVPSPLPIRLLQKRAGITDRAEDLRVKMTTTLANLATAAEAASVSASAKAASTTSPTSDQPTQTQPTQTQPTQTQPTQPTQPTQTQPTRTQLNPATRH